MKIYNQYKNELTTANGLIFKNQSAIIPKSMRAEIINSVRYSHLGINKCLSIVQESIFWPNMTNEIKQKIAGCPIFLKYAKSQNIYRTIKISRNTELTVE